MATTGPQVRGLHSSETMTVATTNSAASSSSSSSSSSPPCTASTSLSIRTAMIRRGEEEEDGDKMVANMDVEKHDAVPGGRAPLSEKTALSPSSSSRQQMQRRQRQQQGNQLETSRRRCTFYILISSAFMLALSSLYFSTTVSICLSQQPQQQDHQYYNAIATLPEGGGEEGGRPSNRVAMSGKTIDSRENTMFTSLLDCMIQSDFGYYTTTATFSVELPSSSRSSSSSLTNTPATDTEKQKQQLLSQITASDVPSATPAVVVPAVDGVGSADVESKTSETINEPPPPPAAVAFNQTQVASKTQRPTIATVGDKKVAVNGGHNQHNLEHPYWGARDENGKSGHVHDPTAHRRPFTISNEERLVGLCNAPGMRNKGVVAGTGSSPSIEGGEMGARALQKVQIATPSARDDDNNNGHVMKPVRLFCAVYTHTGATAQTNALLETWAPRCDGLLLASNATNTTTQHVHIPHKSVAEGKYKGIWQRVRAMMAYLYTNFLNDYDYFHFCGDDTFVLVENLKAFVNSAQVANATNHGQRPLFAGYWAHLKWWGDEYPENFYFLSGGPGYTLSRSALKAFVEQALPTCRAKADDPFEDLNVAWCFYHMLNISGIDTRDETGAQRYHPMSAEMHAKFPQKSYGPPSFMVRKTKEHMEKEFGFPTLYGLDDISTSSVAFHYLKTPVELRRYEMLFYGTGSEQCNNSDATSALAVA